MNDARQPRRIDDRLGPPPNCYLAAPELFGIVADPASLVPEGGAEHLRRCALVVHQLARRLRAAPRGTQADLARTFGVSTTTVSDVAAGKRWPNATVLLAMITIAYPSRPVAPARPDSS